MGASNKRKKEKQKDFVKPKLKVGKAKGKPENYTDTSFKSKSITLNQQSLTLNAPTQSSQFTHALSLTSSKSDSQRRDSLATLTTMISSRPTSSPLPQPVSTLLPPLLPLILDANASVRTNLLKLFKSLPESDVRDHVGQLLPYVRAGMTHLAADIRASAVEVLSWLVNVAGEEVVSVAGAWVKTLNCFLSVLGWHIEGNSKWTSTAPTAKASFGKAGSKGKPQVRVLGVLAEFLDAGLLEQVQEQAGMGMDVDSVDAGGLSGSTMSSFPILQTRSQMIPLTAQPYLYLNLFGAPRDEEGEMYETREDRWRVFEGRFLGAVEKGVEGCRSEGGEVGRASSGVKKVLDAARN
ncbi:Rix1 complex component [Aspergillus karnatakaensis]|uniref:IPI1/TEX10 family protein n=1 Tax=Aspergillus karnatakaensis TaxID=1810916 RepID=UPI003CCDAAD3